MPLNSELARLPLTRFCNAAIIALFLSTPATADEGWEKLDAGGLPSRAFMAMAFDAARNIAVLHGGVIGRLQEIGDTWEFDGSEWRKAAEGGPGLRYAPAMTYDGRRGVILLVAGAWHEETEYRNAGDTWAWDGAEWMKLADDGPPASHGPAMVSDGGRGVAVFFGGYRARNLPVEDEDARRNDFSGETWEWDGRAWSRQSESGPGPRYSAAMAYDAIRGVTVLYGGRDHAGNEYTDTWEWNGETWRRIDAAGPRSTTGHTLVWYADVKQCVLLGGYDFNSDNPREPVKEMWAWDGTKWDQLETNLPADLSWPVASSAPGGGILLVGQNAEGIMETWRFRKSSANH